MKKSAFTLVEVVVVLLILGILAAVAAPRYAESLHRFQIDAASQRLSADIQYVQAFAKQSSLSQQIDFSILNNSYSSSGVPSLDRPSETLSVNVGETPYPATILSASFDGDEFVTFNLFGIPHAAGTVELQVGDNLVTVQVDAEGTVTVLP